MIQCLLYDGIKVFWFGDVESVHELNDKYPGFKKAHLLLTFEYHGPINLIVRDGVISGQKSEFDALSREVPSFDSGQYLVEHSEKPIIVVKAGAGTGKTTVMIDRIMYLLHTRSLDLSDIAMITFTNDATNQMGRRLQEAFIQRYLLTGKQLYLLYLEQTSQISISTIDSFSLSILRKYGTTNGFGNDVTVGSYAQEINRTILDLLNRYHDNRGRVKKIFGVNLYDASKLIKQFYDKIKSKGMSSSQILDLNWGFATDSSYNLQNVLTSVISQIDVELEPRMLRRNSIPLQDLVSKTQNLVEKEKKSTTDEFKYIFVDEFQDTNDIQIRFIMDFSMFTKSNLFVVGDPKQSIYRFRGADDSAFDSLNAMATDKGFEPVQPYNLVNNYRTDPNLLNWMDGIFESWSNTGHLADYKKLIACGIEQDGHPIAKLIDNSADLEKILVADIRSAMQDLKDRIDKGLGKKTDKIAILVRTNDQLKSVLSICDKNQIPRLANRDEPFFTSETVRDFRSMINSYIYEWEPQHIFDFLVSPYASFEEPLDVKELFSLNGDKTLICDHLSDFMESTCWSKYRLEFMNRPILAVIKDMVSKEPIIDNYISIMKSRGITDNDVLELKALRYKLNMDKLMSILFRQFSGGCVSLFEIGEYLRIAAASDRNEMEARIDPDDVESAVVCTTVHKSKGLEYDTVIIPYDWTLNKSNSSEILISGDWKRVGWKFYKKRGGSEEILTNSNYDAIKAEDIHLSECEETRILYVAMTRSIRKLILYRYKPKSNVFSWSTLLKGVRS